jgi:hypothetical protein
VKHYKCSICGGEVPDLPMLVLKHQVSHVKRRPFAGVRNQDLPQERPTERPAG